MINHKRIGRQIRELRMLRGWKQYELAEKVGLSRPAICNIEAGKRNLTLNTLKRFCEVFEISSIIVPLYEKSYLFTMRMHNSVYLR